MKIIKRNEITNSTYREILDVETHHDHEIYEDDHGIIRWKENPSVIKLLEKVSLNDLCPLLNILGYDKNSEVYRKLYRDMGYSLFGYWEVFYWGVNNENSLEYKHQKQFDYKVIKFTRNNWDEVLSFTNNLAHSLSIEKRIDGVATCIISTSKGDITVAEGNWLIKEGEEISVLVNK